MAANEVVTWNANAEFYSYLRQEVWNKISQSWDLLSEAETQKAKLDELEKIHIKVKTWFSFVRFYLDEEEAALLENEFAFISNITKDTEFSACYDLSSDDWTKIRLSIEKIFSKLAYYAAKYGILPSKKDMTGDDVFL